MLHYGKFRYRHLRKSIAAWILFASLAGLFLIRSGYSPHHHLGTQPSFARIKHGYNDTSKSYLDVDLQQFHKFIGNLSSIRNATLASVTSQQVGTKLFQNKFVISEANGNFEHDLDYF